MQIKNLHAIMMALMSVTFVSALPIGNDNGINTVIGNQKSTGDMSPQLELIQATLNKPCVGLPAKTNAQSIVALVNIGVQDINVLSNPQNQQCTENSTQDKGDEPLADILVNIPVLSGKRSLSA
ncbi:hypothetical protein EDD11_000288 [Mortierella claussenii]|nr:hypothetical protein EDD11_000288 [Mortierella claussenii]